MHRACAGKLYKLPWDTHGIQLYTYIPQFHCNPFRHVSQEQIERKNAQFFVLKAGMSQEKGCLSGGPLGGRGAGKGGREGGQGKGRWGREAEKGQEKERGKGGGEAEAGEGGRGKEAGKGGQGRRQGREAGKGGREGRPWKEAGGRRPGRRPGRRGEREAGARAPHVGSPKKAPAKSLCRKMRGFLPGCVVRCGASAA